MRFLFLAIFDTVAIQYMDSCDTIFRNLIKVTKNSRTKKVFFEDC